MKAAAAVSGDAVVSPFKAVDWLSVAVWASDQILRLQWKEPKKT